MTRVKKSVIAASFLTAFVIIFAATAFKPASGKNIEPVNVLTEILEFRLERLETTLTAMQTAMETMIEAMVPLMEQGMEAMLEISEDIGEMADRILAMAEEIGEMADRIVETMNIMADTLLEMQKTMAAMLLALQDGDNPTVTAGVRGADTLLLSPIEGGTLTAATQFELAGDYENFILYASSDAGMEGSTSILVQDNTLDDALERIKGYVSGNKIYVAVKAVDGGAVGKISNTVMVYVP